MMVNRAVCENCDNSVDFLIRGGDLACGECGGQMEFDGKVGCVTSVSNTIHAEAIELAEGWSDEAQEASESGDMEYSVALSAAADELRELVESKRAVPQEGA